MQPDGSVTNWIGQLKQGDARAAQALWERYFRKLVRLARQKLQGTPRRAADEEDAALLAFDSFCRGAEQGRFPQLEDRDNLWELLVVLTCRKAIDQFQHERRLKRGGGQVRGESALDQASEEEGTGLQQVVGLEPDPAFAAEVAEACTRLLDRLGDVQLRAIAVRKMEGHTNAEIAAELGCALATVERRLQLIRRIWSAPQSSA